MGGKGDAAGVRVPENPSPETAGVAPTEKLPTLDPGPPPERLTPGGRESKAFKRWKEQADAAAAEKAVREAEAARRAEQAPLASKVLTPVWSWSFRVTAGFMKAPHWALTGEEAQALGDGLAAVVVKYLDLDILLRYQEEIALAYLVAKAVGPRMKLDRKLAEDAKDADALPDGHDSRSTPVGKKPAPESASP